MSWVVYLNVLCLGKYLCWLKSQLSFISLFSFEMLSNCAMSGLYMRVLKTDLRKIDFCKVFSVERPDGLSWRLDMWRSVVRTVFLGVRTGMEFHCPDGISFQFGCARSVRLFPMQCASGRRYCTVRTGTPQALYIAGHRISSLPHQKTPFWHLVSYFLQAFGFILLLLCLFASHSHSRYFTGAYHSHVLLGFRIKLVLLCFGKRSCVYRCCLGHLLEGDVCAFDATNPGEKIGTP